MMLAARRVAQQHSSTVTRAFATVSGQNSGGQKQTGNDNGGPLAALGAALLGAASAGTVTLMEQKQKLPKQKYTTPAPIPIHGKESHHSDYNDPPPRPDLPTFKLEDVAEHCDESSLWYTFRGGTFCCALGFHCDRLVFNTSLMANHMHSFFFSIDAVAVYDLTFFIYG